MLAILREHPEFQDANRGNTEGADPPRVAALLLMLDRRRDLDDLILTIPVPAKIDLLAGKVAALMDRDQIPEARATLADQIRPVDRDAADRMLASLNGEVVPPPVQPPAGAIPPVPRRSRGLRRIDPHELHLRSALRAIGNYHARQGDVELAGRQLETIATMQVFTPAGYPQLPGFWSNLGVLAHEGGHDDAARQAFDRALQVFNREPNPSAAKARCVQDAVAMGDFALAHDFLRLTSELDGDQRRKLGRLYLTHGQRDRAVALWEEGLQDLGGSRGNVDMAILGGEFYRFGDRQRGEQLLAEASKDMSDIAFGSATAMSVVLTSIRIDRIDLLEQFYQNANAHDKMLLCMAAGMLGSILQDGVTLPD
jgi:hypothetical protein